MHIRYTYYRLLDYRLYRVSILYRLHQIQNALSKDWIEKIKNFVLYSYIKI